jgi:hypothetical protein
MDDTRAQLNNTEQTIPDFIKGFIHPLYLTRKKQRRTLETND